MADSQQHDAQKPFEPATLNQAVVAIPLLRQLNEEQVLAAKAGRKRRGAASALAAPPAPKLFSVIIDLNLQYPGGRAGALQWVVEALNQLVAEPAVSAAQRGAAQDADKLPKNQYSQQYLFVRLTGDLIEALVARDRRRNDAPLTGANAPSGPKAIYRIWPDFPIRGLLNKSISTVKADAAHASYAALGAGIVWAVMDSGIDGTHQHFATHGTLDLTLPLKHTDFTGPAADNSDAALRDNLGHGTHVAGIIAGAWPAGGPPRAYNRQRDEVGEVSYVKVEVQGISGLAPQCKLLSLKVMDEDGTGGSTGETSNLIASIALIQELNGYGRKLLVHGVNMSVGYEFDPEWFACGQSPLCVEINRLVRSGVVVVVAAGNTGYGAAQTQFNGVVSAGMGLTINDPGNAELAITVGSTHREMPHVYGVSYFSSKGPTGDGRAKPDLVAPGERILSCATGQQLSELPAAERKSNYLEESGTSMAAPHVSGAIAAFLSIRREFLGEPEKVKAIFMSTATDLKRERYFQGAGLLDVMRAIQSV